MPNEERVVFAIDLDTKQASVKLSDLKKAMNSVGDASMEGAVSALQRFATFAAEAYAAFKTVQVVWESLFEADRLKAIDASFQQLTQTFGISTEALRSGLEKAADGLIDTTDLLQIANKSIVAMGQEAQRLPEILELARKASVVTGQDVATTFEALSNAIATGNQRALKQMGIIIDVDKAVKDYSKSLGYNADVLSEAGKRQAILNEVLEKGNKALAGIDTNVQENTNTWLRLKATLNDFKDTITLVFEKVAGPTVRKFLDQFREGTEVIKRFFMEIHGNESERAQARIGQIKDRISLLEAATIRLTTGESSAGKVADWFAGWVPGMKKSEDKVKEYRSEIDLLRMELQGLEIQTKKTADAQKLAAAPIATAPKESLVDPEKRKNAEKQLQKDLIQIQQTAAAEKLLIAQNDEQVEEAMAYKRVLLAMQTQEQIRLLRENENLTKAQKQEQEALAYEALQMRLQDLAAQTTQVQIQQAETAAARAEGAWNKFAAGAALASKKAKASVVDFSKLGEATINNFANGVANAFAQVGAGADSLGMALKKAVINAIADIAFAKGAELIASSIWPPNPLGLAAGAGLTALSGVLRRLAGGGASPSAPSLGGGAAGTSPADIPNSTVNVDTARPSAEGMEAPRKGVTIVVQGNYFETEQTRTRLVEMVREAADATDFKILSVGGSV